MVAHVTTVAFEGVDSREIDVQVQMSSGLPAFSIVGLADKAVSEARERVRSALSALGLALPPKRITVNLSPADVQKEGSHYDLPIALGLLVSMDILPAEELTHHIVLGELGLDGMIAPVSGVLLAAMAANGADKGLVCPATNGSEATWAGNNEILAAPSLLSLINHFKGSQILSPPEQTKPERPEHLLDLADVKGQESAKRALEIAAAGGHNLLMSGPPGSGKSMLAARLAGILPSMSAREALETSMIQSIAGQIEEGRLSMVRPFRDPHHSASMPALIGGGQKARPGEVSLAHNGVLFLDELPEFSRQVLDSLRQPLETGRAVVARVNAHVTYPARVQLVAAMNPCRCGHLDDPAIRCSRAPKCARDYQSRLSGPLLDRIDLFVDVKAVPPMELDRAPSGETSRTVAARVTKARLRQRERLEACEMKVPGSTKGIFCNAQADGNLLAHIAAADEEGRALLLQATEKLRLSARGYHRVLKVARTLADLADDEIVSRPHIAEALSFRRLQTD
ncbi:YifB family Mg chelatase-like AAA ATPase [Aestuariispira insulae]|uniref:Magnesium chelatase family protein n=1 Tax=Aestuariispira insulae TaxID=1461337 RepID=A0A3D9HPJ8_9PROT|nr:YifB family Mg chelatase-like AAA ATPase [Aestuariispira insulae]RED51433.1 magnesium chelatase family protein [Aestuariispira insulae]